MNDVASREPVLLERRPPAALVTLKRPDKSNALGPDRLRRLQAVLAELGEDAAVSAVILRGSLRVG